VDNKEKGIKLIIGKTGPLLPSREGWPSRYSNEEELVELEKKYIFCIEELLDLRKRLRKIYIFLMGMSVFWFTYCLLGNILLITKILT